MTSDTYTTIIVCDFCNVRLEKKQNPVFGKQEPVKVLLNKNHKKATCESLYWFMVKHDNSVSIPKLNNALLEFDVE